MSKLTLLLVTALAVVVENGLCRFTDAGTSRGRNGPDPAGLDILGLPSKPGDKNASDIAPDKFITAGSPTGIAQYPWLVHLTIKIHELKGTNIAECGGSLISSRHVITAAHCLDFKIRNYDDVSVYLAEYNTRTFPEDCVGSQCVQNVVMHPDRITKHSQYQRRTVQNDIGMIRLTGPAPNSEYIRPIPLPTFNINEAKHGTSLTIAGWGQTEHGQASSVKLHAQVQLVSPSTCRRYFPVSEGMLCAAGRNGQDCCFGDSGGPIMIEQRGQFQLAGIVSFGVGKCGCGTPSVYTNVFSYLDWIQNNMRD